MTDSEKSSPPELPGHGWAVRPMGLVWLIWLIAAATFWGYLTFGPGAAEKLSYSAFKDELAAGHVVSCSVTPDEIRGQLQRNNVGVAARDLGFGTDLDSESDAADLVTFSTVRVDDPELWPELRDAGVEVTGARPSPWPGTLLLWLVPLGLLVLFMRMGSRVAGGFGQAAMTFGKSRARLIADRAVGVSFDDVAGCDEAKAELAEVVEFLAQPKRFTDLGAKIPKGVLLVGPPGTGKTLLARAVAGEAGVPFFSLSGSDFVEMFVGVGAARVRDLFEQAKQHAPCIVFIDELDAIGRTRGVNVGNVNDEREHTLNQLLVEMDGFEANAGVILLSATNRPDVLDAALLRPGRFDRQVILDSPDIAARLAILEVHARGKPLAADANLNAVARETPGFSGADLANVMNEAAIGAARARQSEIAPAHLEEAVEKVVAGPERKSRRLEIDEKRRVAYHEAGHAVVALHSATADPVHRISIVPRGRAALGYTLQLPTGDQHLLTRTALFGRIRGLLGGRAAEQAALGEVSTGSENDLEQATNLARSVVGRFGMGESERLLHCGSTQHANVILSSAEPSLTTCSEQTAAQLDEEAERLLERLYQEASQILEQHKGALERVAEALVERESLDAEEFLELASDITTRSPERNPQ